jgi:type IV pilus assembly protein PilA
VSALFPAAPASQRTWFGRTANGLGLTCLLLAILTGIFANASRTLCGYSVLMVLLTAPLALLTILLGFLAREKFAWRTAAVGLGIVLLVVMNYGFPPCGERIASNDVSAVASLRAIVSAQQQIAGKNPQKGFATALAELGPSGADLIDGVLAQGAKSGYRFTLEPGPPDTQGRITAYMVHAIPVLHGSTGNRSFVANQAGSIWQTPEARPATIKDLPVN